MNIPVTTRRIVIAALFVPAVALAGLAAEAWSGKSEAQAQQQQREREVPDSSDPAAADLPPCPPGIAASPNCRPWNPPRRAESAETCECEIRYQTVNGKRVTVKDCYVLLPDNQVYYCENERLVRR